MGVNTLGLYNIFSYEPVYNKTNILMLIRIFAVHRTLDTMKTVLKAEDTQFTLHWVKTQELEVPSLYHLYCLKTKRSQCHCELLVLRLYK